MGSTKTGGRALRRSAARGGYTVAKSEGRLSDEGANARLTAIEFLVAGLWTQFLAALAAEEAQRARCLVATGANPRKPAARRGGRPTGPCCGCSLC